MQRWIYSNAVKEFIAKSAKLVGRGGDTAKERRNAKHICTNTEFYKYYKTNHRLPVEGALEITFLNGKNSSISSKGADTITENDLIEKSMTIKFAYVTCQETTHFTQTWTVIIMSNYPQEVCLCTKETNISDCHHGRFKWYNKFISQIPKLVCSE